MAAAKSSNATRFDVAKLRERAGDKVFERGEDYFHDDQVQILAIEPNRVLAQVAGSEDYRTELTGRGKTIGGSCSCPAYVDWGFCKHMVAVGLAANDAADSGVEDGGALSRIRAHLKTRSVADLAELVANLAERDPKLLRKLELAAAATGADDTAVEATLRKAIDTATRTGGYVDYGSASGWAAGVDEALDAIEPLASTRAGIGLKLAERAIERIERAIKSMDDSDGYCGGLLSRARDIHLAAVSAARPEPVRLARDLFAREMKDDYDVFSGAAATYAEVLGDAGLAEYRRLAVAASEKLPARGRSRSSDDVATDSYRLIGILDFFAERDGDVDARIALRVRNLSSPWSYLKLAEFCLSQGRSEQALRHAEEGLWMFEDGRQDQRLVLFAAELLTKANRKTEAAAHLWRAFEKAPSVELYGRVRELAGEPARERALGLLETRSAKEAGEGWTGSSDLLIRLLIKENMFDEAWAALRKSGGSSSVRDDLARASEKTHPREALEVYGQGVERLATSGIYSEAAKLITRMAKLQGAPEHSAYLAILKERHRRKRNFMKLLE